MMKASAVRWVAVLLTVLSMLAAGCGSAQRSGPVRLENGTEPSRVARLGDTMPNVLVIGDSISIGYFGPAKKLLEGTAQVYHNPGNAAHTANGLARLDEWLGDISWDVIHFNHGLHDMKYVDETGKRVSPAEGRQQIPIGTYERNLAQLTERLQKTGATLIFATTTPVPEGAHGRIKGDADRYNAVAIRIMEEYNIRINDLYSFALPRRHAIQRPRDVHFTGEGSRLLAEQVVDHIRRALAEE
jgi:lysophospholipase L1-like esterase